MGVKRVLNLFLAILFIFILFSSLLVKLLMIWLTIDWKARKARRNFEKEVIKYGVTRRHAKKLSVKYMALKKDLKRIFKQSFGSI